MTQLLTIRVSSVLAVLAIAGDSAFALFSVHTTVKVQVLSNTSQDVPVANGDMVPVRGLLFFARNTQANTRVASSMAHQMAHQL